MPYDPSKHHRRSIRLKGYDYSQSGAYFVTIRTRKGEPFFGNIVHGEVKCSPIGRTAEEFWQHIPQHFSHVELDEFKVMPNHLHGIIFIWEDDDSQPEPRPVELNAPTDYFSKISPKRKTLSVIIRTYKAAVTKWCWENGFENFRWQSNYHEHIVRNENSLNRIRPYIASNAQRWELDKENPERTGADPFDAWLGSIRSRPPVKPRSPKPTSRGA